MTTVPALRVTVERPQLHFTPARNWMNDPNGLVFVDGVYHPYFQCNPFGMDHRESHGAMPRPPISCSGPSTLSPSQPTWTSRCSPVASSSTTRTRVGSHRGIVPLWWRSIPVRTRCFRRAPDIQAQSIAVSIDGGYTWTRHAENPVLDRGSADFRDPKVFRYDDGHRSYWVMVAVEARRHEVVLYRSDNLVDWDHHSTFSPANATGGVWNAPISSSSRSTATAPGRAGS